MDLCVGVPVGECAWVGDQMWRGVLTSPCSPSASRLTLRHQAVTVLMLGVR
jgi:hypothetical protein